MDAVVEKLRSAYAALGEGDKNAALAMLAADCEWHESGELPGGSVLRGRQAVGEFLDSFLESWERFDQTIEDCRLQGNRVLLLIHLRAVGRASKLELDTRYAHVWTIRDGLGARVDAYRDQEEARADFAREASTTPAAPPAAESDQKTR